MRRKRLASGRFGVALATTAEPAAASDDVVERQESVERLRVAMAGLTERQREAVVLRFFEERSVEETADLMQCAPGTVKATVHQAMAAMKLHFGVKR